MTKERISLAELAQRKEEYYGARRNDGSNTQLRGNNQSLTCNFVVLFSHACFFLPVELLETSDDSLRRVLNQRGGLVLARVGRYQPWPARVRASSGT